MEACKSCGEGIETGMKFCPKCGSSQSADTMSMGLSRKEVKVTSLVMMAVGFCMIPLIMATHGLGLMLPLLSSLLIMLGLNVYTWSSFGAWWQE